ncbi:hypothetical protein ZWY2020_025595 [Hordeum vulgare]|nr:hypothetical protein ZWY2020_025595 [Hordeum vulgare]
MPTTCAAFVTALDAVVDLNIATVAKAPASLNIPRESIQVASAHPEDYLIRFTEPYQRDLALEHGYIRVEGIRLQLEQWEPAPAGTIHSLCFYCRLAISGIKFHAWRLDVIKKLLGSSCIVDRMERQTERLKMYRLLLRVGRRTQTSSPRRLISPLLRGTETTATSISYRMACQRKNADTG